MCSISQAAALTKSPFLNVPGMENLHVCACFPGHVDFF